MTALAEKKSNASEVAKRLGITTTLYAYVNGDVLVKAAEQAIFKQNCDGQVSKHVPMELNPVP